jgi:hypothetical protein
MDSGLISALIGFGGAIVGGLMQSAFSYFQSGRQFIRETRHRDYNLFVEAIAGMSQADHNESARKEFIAKAIEAKAGILLKSSPSVIHALGKYSKHAVLSSPDSYSDFANLLAAMRSDIGGEFHPSFASSAIEILFEGGKKIETPLSTISTTQRQHPPASFACEMKIGA